MHYDYIIAGGGGAGLSLLYYLLQEPALKQKRILLIDKEAKDSNDRTWCFWEAEESPFEHLLTASWEQLYFHSANFSSLLNISPYKYKMLRSSAFYSYIHQLAIEADNVDLLQGEEISDIEEVAGVVQVGERKFTGDYIFSSLPNQPVQDSKYFYLLQHFKGWFVKTEKPSFNPHTPTLMDFRINQEGDCRFVYVLPLNEYEALVEYTIFSDQLLESQEVYDQGVESYLKSFLKLEEYEIIEKEFGVIPMTNAPFLQPNSPKVMRIGTAGGHTKASTGYTFQFIQKECKHIAQQLAKGNSPKSPYSFNKYHWFDSIFLRVLQERPIPSYKVFEDLFKNLPPHLPLRFLDESTNLLEDLRVMNAVEKLAFIQATAKEVMR